MWRRAAEAGEFVWLEETSTVESADVFSAVVADWREVERRAVTGLSRHPHAARIQAAYTVVWNARRNPAAAEEQRLRDEVADLKTRVQTLEQKAGIPV